MIAQMIEKKEKKSDRKAIVLAADYQYSEQVLTTIKSICYHNRQITFYLINSDFPTEWFLQLEKKLAELNCRIINARVSEKQVQGYKTDISYTVFLRYFIADFVAEDRVLYLDCDLVVTSDLTELFKTDLGDAPLAAVKDLGAQVYYGEDIFNAGVLLINNHLWKSEQVTQRLIELTNDWHEQVFSGDQSILNMLFKDRWLELPFAYNSISLHTEFSDDRPAEGAYPPIIHYLTERKPWKIYTQTVYRDVWWFYNGLEWSDFKEAVPALTRPMVQAGETASLSCMVYTFSCQLLHIEYLIQALPQCHFYLAAPVVVADEITRLLKYSNVSVCSDIVGLTALQNDIIDRCDLLLDINAGEEVDGIVARFKEAGKAVYAFDSSVHGQQGQKVFRHQEPAAMVKAIEYLIEKPQNRTIPVKPIDQTLDYILEHEASVIRYGDGEMDLIAGKGIPYQEYNPYLSARLRQILSRNSSEKLLICLSDVFENLKRYSKPAVDFWNWHTDFYQEEYQEICQAPWYGSTFISRPYMDLVDKSPSAGYFEKIKKLWQDKDILIVEGVTSRSGVGNDLFAAAKSIQRIICPSKNAFSKLEEIQQEIRKISKDHLILVMLGPTAKVLVDDLVQEGYRAIDIGHIDSEYEWFRLGADHKVKLSHKHTAEFNYDEGIHFLKDPDYEDQIAASLAD